MTRTWKRKPVLYEINTRVWLTDLSRQYKRRITLANVPDAEVDALAARHIDAVWLMGVWTRSEAVRRSAMNYTHEYTPVLPDLHDEDVIGSAYAIGYYQVDPNAGRREGLAAFREQLHARGLKLVLDYVPNHVAVDHPAIQQQPTLFVMGSEADFQRDRGNFFKTKDAWGRELIVAHGRDPYFPGWIDTAQINAFNAAARRATISTLNDIAAQCDGVRCDMAMLMTNEVFNRTWGWLVPEPPPETDFWDEVIPAVRAEHPDFLFIAEVYWNMDYQLQNQGFDFTYDKVLYDRMFEASTEALRTHLLAELSFQERTVRFIENHDEGRAADAFGPDKSRAMATIAATLPGALLLHAGQFSGRVVKLPVQIGRQPHETPNADLEAFYRGLLAELRHPVYQRGFWRMFDVHEALMTPGGPLLAYGWYDDERGDRRLIVVNVSEQAASGAVDLRPWGEALRALEQWGDTPDHPERSETHNTDAEHGFLHLVMGPWASRVYAITPVDETVTAAGQTSGAPGNGHAHNGSSKRDADSGLPQRLLRRLLGR